MPSYSESFFDFLKNNYFKTMPANFFPIQLNALKRNIHLLIQSITENFPCFKLYYIPLLLSSNKLTANGFFYFMWKKNAQNENA